MVSKGGTSTFSISGIFASPSIVNTDVKKSASTLAFSLSELVDSVLLSSLNKSGILLFVFVLDLAYFQNFLGFVLTSCAICFSNCLVIFLVNVLT
jgi:hypothetical protein